MTRKQLGSRALALGLVWWLVSACAAAQVLPGPGGGSSGAGLPTSGTTGAALIKTATDAAWSATVFEVSGDIGIGTATPNVLGAAAASRVLTIQSESGVNTEPVIEWVTDRTVGNLWATAGSISAYLLGQDSGHQQIAQLRAGINGDTSGQRGGGWGFYTKANGVSGILERMRLTAAGNLFLGYAPTSSAAASQTGYNGLARTVVIESAAADTSGYSGVELVSNRTDATDAPVGDLSFFLKTATTNHTRIAAVTGTTDGATATQRGGRIGFWTKPDASTTLTERLRITQAGDIGVGTTTPNYNSFSRALTVESPTTATSGFPTLELVTNRDNAANISLADVSVFFRSNSTGHQRVATMLALSEGATANQLGGQWRWYTKANGSTTLSERLRIAQDGNVLVANLAGSGNRAVYSDPSGNLTNSSSDARLKTNVEPITEGLALVEQLQGVRFDWIDTARFGAQREIGVLAQDVQAVVPEIVGVNADGTLSVDYPKLTAVLIEAVKALSARVRALEGAQ